MNRLTVFNNVIRPIDIYRIFLCSHAKYEIINRFTYRVGGNEQYCYPYITSPEWNNALHKYVVNKNEKND